MKHWKLMIMALLTMCLLLTVASVLAEASDTAAEGAMVDDAALEPFLGSWEEYVLVALDENGTITNVVPSEKLYLMQTKLTIQPDGYCLYEDTDDYIPYHQGAFEIRTNEDSGGKELALSFDNNGQVTELTCIVWEPDGVPELAGETYLRIGQIIYRRMDDAEATAEGDAAAVSTEEHTDRETVKAVQQALNDAGYDCGAPDGLAGKKTAAAITACQTDNGLTVTGTVTDELLVALGLAGEEKVDAADAGAVLEPFLGVWEEYCDLIYRSDGTVSKVEYSQDRATQIKLVVEPDGYRLYADDDDEAPWAQGTFEIRTDRPSGENRVYLNVEDMDQIPLFMGHIDSSPELAGETYLCMDNSKTKKHYFRRTFGMETSASDDSEVFSEMPEELSEMPEELSDLPAGILTLTGGIPYRFGDLANRYDIERINRLCAEWDIQAMLESLLDGESYTLDAMGCEWVEGEMSLQFGAGNLEFYTFELAQEGDTCTVRLTEPVNGEGNIIFCLINIRSSADERNGRYELSGSAVNPVYHTGGYCIEGSGRDYGYDSLKYQIAFHQSGTSVSDIQPIVRLFLFADNADRHWEGVYDADGNLIAVNQ